MKRNKKGIIALAAFAVIATLASTALVSGTLAKYTGTMKGTDTATVAKFEFTVNDETFTNGNSANETFEIDLFETATKYSDYFISEGSEKLIAPGISGSFDIVVVNNSEVPVKRDVHLTLKKVDSLPITFEIDGTKFDTSATGTTHTYSDDGFDENDTITVSWNWPYENPSDSDYDRNDTALGLEGAKTIEVTAVVTVTQADPNATP